LEHQGLDHALCHNAEPRQRHVNEPAVSPRTGCSGVLALRHRVSTQAMIVARWHIDNRSPRAYTESGCGNQRPRDFRRDSPVIVDVHTHFLRSQTDVGPQVISDMQRCDIDPAVWSFTAEDHLRATSKADHAVVFGLSAAKTGWRVPNDAVAAHVEMAPDRLIFFASVDPGQDGFMEELERCHQELRCRGVKLGPIYQGVHPLDKRYYEIYGYCERNSLPVVTHMAATFSSGVPLDYARPAHMDQVAIDFPDLKIVLAHMGHPWEAETVASIRKQANLFADISALYYRPWQFYNAMQLAVEYGAHGKLLFGSDFPATTTADSIAGVRRVNGIVERSGLPSIPGDLIEEIIHRDSLDLLGIPKPEGRTVVAQ
jgi:predicted TIM-barrel fold metal-dependent hydrolase